MSIRKAAVLAVFVFAAVAATLVASATTASADDVVTFQNFWRKTYLGAGSGSPALLDGTSSAQARWILEPVRNPNGLFTPYYRLRTMSGDYLYMQGSMLKIGAVQPDMQGAMWVLEPLADGTQRIRNRVDPANALNTQNGSVSAGRVESGWWSAMWTQSKVAEVASNWSPPQPAAAQPQAQTQAPPTGPVDQSRVVQLTVNNYTKQTVSILFYNDDGVEETFNSVPPQSAIDFRSYPNLSWAFRAGNLLLKRYAATTTAQQTLTFTDNDIATAQQAAQATQQAAQAAQSSGSSSTGDSGTQAATDADCQPPNGASGRRMRLTAAALYPFTDDRVGAMQVAGVNKLYQMDDGSCAVAFTLNALTSGTKSLPNPAGASFHLDFTPRVVAWVDDETNAMHITVDTGENFFLQVSGYDDATKKRGPFVKEATTEVYTPRGFSTENRWPINNMGSSTVSKTRGFSLNANLNVSPTVAMSGAGAGVGVNFDTTTTSTYDDYLIAVAQPYPNVSSYKYKLCGVSSNARESQKCTYAFASDLIARDRESTLGQTVALHALPTLAYSFDVGRSITTFEATSEPPAGEVHINIRVMLTFARAQLSSRSIADAQAVAEAFFFWANPRFYEGDLVYDFVADPDTTQVFDYTIVLDVDQLRAQMH